MKIGYDFFQYFLIKKYRKKIIVTTLYLDKEGNDFET